MTDRLELAEPSQGLLRQTRQLVRAKKRRESGLFLAEGRQAVREAVASGRVESLFVRWAAAHDHDDLIAQARAAGVEVYGVSEQNIATMSDTVTPQGLVAVVRHENSTLASVFSGRDPQLVVICAQVRDPGNAGTVIRCADAFGADAVILTADSVEVTNPKVVRASVGSMFHLPVVSGVALADAVDAARAAGLQVWAADGASGEVLTELASELARPTAWVMGNEAWGLPSDHLSLADRSVGVPIYGAAESLNLATAAAVCLYASSSAQRAGTPAR